MTNTAFSRSRIQGTPSSTHSRERVYNGVLELCLPYAIGEVASARSWLMTEGSVYGDPSVSSLDEPDARATSPINGGDKKVFKTRTDV